MKVEWQPVTDPHPCDLNRPHPVPVPATWVRLKTTENNVIPAFYCEEHAAEVMEITS